MEKTISLGHSKVINVEEIQGLNGSLSISEFLLQKIWANKDFLHNNLYTHSQKKLQILHPGRWNRFEGPDFKEAEILLDGEKVTGDIEIHFHTNDWFHHGHSSNNNFSNVILHVTLFEPSLQHPQVFNSYGFCPDTLVLLPYLRQSLEEYALEEALLNFENRNNTEYLQAYLNKPSEELYLFLLDNALLRWKQKCSFARARLKTDTWENICHQMFLEALGFLRNRAPMNSIATHYPINYIRQHQTSANELFLSEKSNWKLAKLRPQNHPLKRLTQYLHLIKENPHWPSIWQNFSANLPYQPLAQTTSHFRKNYQLSQMHSHIQQSILAKSVSGTRFNTILIDALLPLAAVYYNKDFFHLWFHWFPGDMPSNVSSFLDPKIFFSKKQPFCNGINQAVLQLFIQNRIIN